MRVAGISLQAMLVLVLAPKAELARQIEQWEADIVAVQEVKNVAAARRVFPASEWNIEMSGRPPMARSRACWGKSGSVG